MIISEEKKEENKIFIDLICNNLMKQEDVKYKELNELFNILSYTNNENENTYINQFLNNIKLYYNQRVFFLKNKKNFIHLSNIMNHIYIKNRTNYYIVNTIIEISQKIKCENNYLYKIIRKKNQYLAQKHYGRN